MGDASKLIEAVAALAWPLLVALLLWQLLPAIRSIMGSRNFTVKFGNVEVSVQDAAEKIQKQLSDLNSQVASMRAPEAAAARGSLRETLESRPPASDQAPVRGTRILWVDDKPGGNALEAAQLRERGIEVIQVCSTEDAMSVLAADGGFTGVVSDMGREEQGRYRATAGLSLLAAMRAAAIDLPFLVYTGRRSAATYHPQVQQAGGSGATSSTVDLFEWIQRLPRA